MAWMQRVQVRQSAAVVLGALQAHCCVTICATEAFVPHFPRRYRPLMSNARCHVVAQADLSLSEVKLLEEEGHKPVRLQLYADIKGERVDSDLGYLEARPSPPRMKKPSCCGLPHVRICYLLQGMCCHLLGS